MFTQMWSSDVLPATGAFGVPRPNICIRNLILSFLLHLSPHYFYLNIRDIALFDGAIVGLGPLLHLFSVSHISMLVKKLYNSKLYISVRWCQITEPKCPSQARKGSTDVPGYLTGTPSMKHR